MHSSHAQTSAVAQAADAAQIPVANFFRPARITSAQLSPNGKSLAMLNADADGKLVLTVTEVDKLQPRVIAKMPDMDVVQFHWVNNNRLVYGLGDRDGGVSYFGTGLYAVGKDGGKPLMLVSRETHAPTQLNKAVTALPWDTFYLDSIHAQESDDIYVIQGTDKFNNQFTQYDLLRLNTVTGNTTLVPRPGKVVRWLIDKTGEPRVAETREGDLITIQYKDPKNNQWRKLMDYRWTAEDGMTPVFLSPEGDLYVVAYNGGNTKALYQYDLGKNELLKESVITLKGYDFNGSLIYNTQQQKVLGISYEMSRPATLWFDEDLQKLQKKIDTALPDTINQLHVPEQAIGNVVVVNSFSDVQPAFWQLYNRETGKFVRLGSSRPDIDSRLMSFKDAVRYKARDGLDIPGYLTLPAGSSGKNLPLVMLVHGGPNVRGTHWGWNPEVQFLASRGYAVLEPEFRGSTGYGRKHFEAGWRQWGLAMQDDIADGAKWAVAQGYADPKRICIAGASYGGYATLMGLLNDPGLYRCGIDWVGVTDINLLYDIHWSDISDDAKKYSAPILIGDQVKDAAQLKATSPIENAARIKQPLLMAYGNMDRRVPIKHGTRFYSAVKETNPHVEWVEYSGEGHGWRMLKTNVDFWTRVEKFLQQNDNPVQ
ncbi:peptidase [Undibacterium terreum]|uniref:Peptidase n=2 Tax=Undibacterium terreum TaxID=1224302 RepID=A0A916XGF1_9BURK|nr:peptidase [Undibacterium terreum]